MGWMRRVTVLISVLAALALALAFVPQTAYADSTISVSVTKVWIGDARESATVHLFANGDDTGRELTLTEDNGWTDSFSGLPKMDSEGYVIEYTVEEDSIDGYTTAITDPTEVSDTEISFEVRNTQQISVSGTKVWNDADDQDGIRPNSVTVNLLQDEELYESQTMTEGDGGAWSFSFNGLAKCDSEGHYYTYTVEEDVPDGYTATYSGDASGHYTITNTHEPEKTSVSVSKVWEDDGDRDGKRPDSVKVQLYADGVASGDAVALSPDNGWSYEWSDLDKYSAGQEVAYTVEETVVPDGYTSAVSGDAASGFTVTNTHEPETTSVSVSKKWVGAEGSSVNIHLLADGEDTGEELALSEDNGWTGSFDGVYKYANGEEISYTVKEDSMEGYTTSITGDAESGFTVTNTETVDIPVWKVWYGNPGESATVHLFANGTEVASATLNSGNAWTNTFEGLSQYDSDGNEITYTLTEDAIDGYSTSITGDASSGFTVTNMKQTSVSGTVSWVDDGNRDGIRPSSATVILLRDGVEIATQTVASSDDGTSFSFNELDGYDSEGNEYTYTVSEVTPEGYAVAINGTAITNTHTPETISIPVYKKWVGTVGGPVTIHLYANGTDTGEKLTLSADNGWTDSFENIYRYAEGEEITYNISEDAVAGYSSAITGDASSGFTVTNTQQASAGGSSTRSDNKPRRPSNPVQLTKAAVPKMGDSSVEGAVLASIAFAGLAMTAIALRRKAPKHRRM